MNLAIDWRLILLTLAVYRIAQLIAIDRGPFAIFERLRDVAYKYHELGMLLSCPYCLHIWIVAALLVLGLICLPAFDAAVLLFGVAGAAAFLQTIGDQ